MSGDGAFDNHDMPKDAVSSLALMAKLPSGGVPFGLASWAVHLTGPEILWMCPFTVSSALLGPPAGLVCTVGVAVAEAELCAG